jgi:AhpD family alkylhydroperoxidase
VSDANVRLAAVNERLMTLFKADKQTIKELTAVAIAVAKGCEDCILYHVAAARNHGASRGELAEILAVSVEMSGGPGAVYAAKALATFDEMAAG